MRTIAVPILALLLAATPAEATAQQASEAPTEHLAERDRGRIERFDDTLGRAAVEALKGGAIEDLATLQEAIGGEPRDMTEADLLGDWRCRTIKMGGNLPLVVYSFFACRIESDGDGLRLVKLTGSQRTSGRLLPLDGGAYLYAGALHYADEEPKAYRAEPERDMVGRLVRNGQDRLWLGLPEPEVESLFDVIELVRR